MSPASRTPVYLDGQTQWGLCRKVKKAVLTQTCFLLCVNSMFLRILGAIFNSEKAMQQVSGSNKKLYIDLC